MLVPSLLAYLPLFLSPNQDTLFSFLSELLYINLIPL